MARLNLPEYEDLSPHARELQDRLTARRGRIDGMYRTLLNHPALLEKVSALGTFLRFEGSVLPPDVRELAILYCARRMTAPYEWVKHVPPARQAGVPEGVIEDLRVGRRPRGLSPEHEAVLQCALSSLERRSVPADVQAAIVAAYGVEGVVELVVLCGFYAMISGVIFAFDVPLPEGESDPFGPAGEEQGKGGHEA